MKIAPEVLEYYTDILSHSFEPGGQHIAAGTTMGKFIIIERDWEKNEAFSKMETTTPNSKAVLGLTWGNAGVFVGGKTLLCLYRQNDDGYFEDDAALEIYDSGHDVQDVASWENFVYGACDDCNVRGWDVHTKKLLVEFDHHKMPVEVCRVNGEFLVSGGQDGKVFVYDASLRTDKPITSFDQGKRTITGLDISCNSTWVAAGSVSSPCIYNIKNSAVLPQIEKNGSEKLYAVHFDTSNALWWGGAGKIYKSQNLTSISSEMKAQYGDATVYHVYSITTTTPRRLSVAGSSTGILFSDNSEFWEGMVHI